MFSVVVFCQFLSYNVLGFVLKSYLFIISLVTYTWRLHLYRFHHRQNCNPRLTGQHPVFRLRASFCKYSGDTGVLNCQSIQRTGGSFCFSCYYRIRRTDPCKASGGSVYAGGYCSIHCSHSLCATDRCCNRARRRRCQDHLF